MDNWRYKLILVVSSFNWLPILQKIYWSYLVTEKCLELQFCLFLSKNCTIALICHARSILIVTFSQGEVGPQGLGREGKKGQRGEQVSQRLKFPDWRSICLGLDWNRPCWNLQRRMYSATNRRFQFLTFKRFSVPFYSWGVNIMSFCPSVVGFTRRCWTKRRKGTCVSVYWFARPSKVNSNSKIPKVCPLWNLESRSR